MFDLNEITITGRLVKDPVSGQTSTQKTSSKFTVANNYEKDRAYFFNCVAYEKVAEFIQNNFSKGSPVLLKGTMRIKNWKDQTSGNWINYPEVLVNKIYLLGRYKDKEENKSEQKEEELPDFEMPEFEQ